MNEKNLKVTCSTCGIKLNQDFMGKKCPRCNNVIIPQQCEFCNKNCTK